MPTGLEIFKNMLNEGLSPEEAKAGVVDYLGFTPTMEQLRLSREELNAMRPGAGAAQQQPAEGSGLTITGLPPVDTFDETVAGPQFTNFIPQPIAQQPIPQQPAVEPEARMGDAIVEQDGSPGFLQGPSEFVASLAGLAAGAGKGAFDFGYELGSPKYAVAGPHRRLDPRATMPPIDVGFDVEGASTWTSLDEPDEDPGYLDRALGYFSDLRSEGSATSQAFQQAKEAIERDTDFRLAEDIVSNVGANTSDVIEGLTMLGLDVIDWGGDELDDESWTEGVTRAFTETLGVAPAMAGGMAAFLKQLQERPWDTIYTHPTDAAMTIAPMVPKIFRLAKKGNSKAAAYLKKLEDKGVIINVTDPAWRPKGSSLDMDLSLTMRDPPIRQSPTRISPDDAVTLDATPVVRGARRAVEAPGRLLETPVKVPLPSKPNFGRGTGDVDLSFPPKPAVGTSQTRPMPRDIPRAPFEPQVRTPVIERADGKLSGGLRPLDIGDLLYAALGGAVVGKAFDEEEAFALLAPAFRIVKGAAPNATIELFAKWLLDQASRGDPRIHTKVRDMVHRPNQAEAELSMVGKELSDPEVLASIDPDAARVRLPVGTKPGGVARVRDLDSPDNTALEEGPLHDRVSAGLEQPVVIKDLGPRAETLMTKLEGILVKSLSESRMGEGPTRLYREQKNFVPAHMAMIRELMSGDSVGLLAHEGVKKKVLSKLIREGHNAEATGSWLKELASVWEGGSNTVAMVRRKRRARGFEPEVIEDVPITRYIQDAVARSPKAQMEVINNTMGIIHKQTALDHRAKILADTSIPVSSIYQDWATKAKNVGKSFIDFTRENPGGYQDMWARLYELEKGLIDGSPVLFLPFKDASRNKFTRAINENPGHRGGVVDKIVERHPDLSPELVRQDVNKLIQRVRNEFIQRDELGGFVDKKTAKAFDAIDKATDMSMGGGFFGAVNRFGKKALTVFSAATSGFQVIGNALVQSIDRGTTLSATLADFVKGGIDFVAYDNGKRFGPAENRFFGSVKKTGALDTDQLRAETKLIEGRGFFGKIGKAAETAYRYGDVLAKLSEIRVVYNRVLSDLKMLKDGDTATLMVDSTKAVQLKKVGDKYFRDGKPLSLDDLSDIAARGAAMAADNKFFNYFDTGLLSTTLRGAPLVGIGSLFYTWFSKALFGRRGGLAGNVIMGEFSPIVDSSSTALMAKQLKDSMTASLRRTAFHQVGDIEDRARRDAYREMASYHNIQSPILVSGPVNDEGVVGIKSLQNVDLFGPFNMTLRAFGGAVALARGDTKAENLAEIKKRIKESAGDSLEDKRRMSLAIRQLTGRGLNPREAIQFVGMSGGPLLEFVVDATSNFKDKFGRPMSPEKAAMKFGASMMGSTLFHGVQAARAIISEKGLFDDLPERVKLDPELKETAARFGIRQIFRLAYTPTRVESRKKSKFRISKSGKVSTGKPSIVSGKKGSIDYHVEGFERELKAKTAGRLKKEAKRFERAEITRMVTDPATGKEINIIDKLKDEAAFWDGIIADEAQRLRDRLLKQLDADRAEIEHRKNQAGGKYRTNREIMEKRMSERGLELDPDSIFLRGRMKKGLNRPKKERRPGDNIVESSTNSRE